MKRGKSKKKPQAVGRRLRPLVRPLNAKVKAWDVVELEGFTGLFRTYSLPPKSKAGRWLFCSLYADVYVTEINMGERVKVTKILCGNWQKARDGDFGNQPRRQNENDEVHG